MSFADGMHALMAFLGVNKDYQAIGPFLGAILGSLLSAGVVGGIVHARTKRHQEALALFEFDKKFHELADYAHALAKLHGGGENPCTPIAMADARAYYRKLFDLMSNEYYFFRQGFVGVAPFTQWMRWRWGAWHDIDGARVVVCDLKYQDAWREWSTRPLMAGNRFIAFIDKVHAAPDLAAVSSLVVAEAPHWWRR